MGRSASSDGRAGGARTPWRRHRKRPLGDGWQESSVEANSRVQLPPGVGASYEVYVNGVRQEPGRDFDRIGDELIFRRALAQEGRLGPIRWLSMLLGVAGTYRKHENVDVVYEQDGRRTVATLVPS